MTTNTTPYSMSGKLTRRLLTTGLVLIHLLTLLLIPATYTWPAEKLVLLATGSSVLMWLTRALSDGQSRPVWYKLYSRLYVGCGGMVILFLTAFGPDLLDRKIEGLRVYSLVVSKQSMQEEMQLTIYRHRFFSREPVAAEFFENGIGRCRAYIGESKDIETDCR